MLFFKKRCKRLGKQKPRTHKKVPLPKVGEQFKAEHLPELPLMMYKRLSQIYGIPLSDLLPYRKAHEYHLAEATYSGRTHEITIDTGLLEDIKKLLRKEPERASEIVLTEELLHSIQFLLQKAHEKLREYRIEKYALERAKTKKERKEAQRLLNRTFPERKKRLENTLGLEPSAQIHYKHGALSDFLNSLRYFAGFGTIRLGYIARRKLRSYFERYGPDGLLLLYADPPENWNMALLDEKEKFFVENGLLKEGQGLTEKGIKYIREKVPRGVIIEVLRIMKERREKRI